MSNKNVFMAITLGSFLLGFYLATIVENLQIRLVVILFTGMVSGWSLRTWWMDDLWDAMNTWRFRAHRRRHVIEAYEKEIQRLGGKPEDTDGAVCNDECGDPSEWEF